MEKSFEEALTELEEIVSKLEGGKLSLEESVQLFEQGTSLMLLCRNKLKGIEAKIEVLSSQLSENN